MKLAINFKNVYIELVCLLYILLFIYAACSKILNFDTFRIQLGQSPLLSPLADWISFIVPILELAISFLLVFKRTKCIGLWASFVLMTLFSFYIYVILNYSAFIPCSCGGILEKLSWNQHLLFNIYFVVLAGIAILLFPPQVDTENRNRSNYFHLQARLGLELLVLLSSGVFMFLLFSYSEEIIHYKNKFIRRFPQHVAQEIYKVDLKFNSYYFAGSANGKIYLGNKTAPLKMLVLDTASKSKQNFKISLKQRNLRFSVPKIRVLDNDFFVYEGIVPYVFKGNTQTWNASLSINSGYYFSQLVPMDSTNLAIRFLVPKSGENALGSLNLKDTLKAKFDTNLLKKQFDGVFDTDGILLYNGQLNRIVYVYYYRNEFLVIKPDLKLERKGKTIDTISKAQVDLIQYEKSKMKTFLKPPLMVNKAAATYGKFLFIRSTLAGLYESDKIWRIASIIDVYDVTDSAYRSSFLVYDIKGRKVRTILIYGNFLYALIDDQLVCYKLLNYLSQERAVHASEDKKQ